MPKLNYGFKGSSLTAAQAVAAGAVSTSQDYQYIVQLGAVTPLTAPSAPTSLSATPGDAQVALSWSAPSSAGSSAVTGYQIVYVADDGTEVTSTTSGTSQTITGLTNGTSYFFAVTAVNASAGAGSPASVGATPVAITVPGAPTGLTATAGNGQVALSWTAPANNGGEAISYYSIRYWLDGTSGYITSQSDPSIVSKTITGLTNGTSVNFTVAACNSVGCSAASSTVSATPATTPSAPTGLTATTGNGQVALSWTAPDSNGSAITGYAITYSGTTINTGSTNTSYTVTGLNTSSSYSFTVAAINGKGTGAASASVASATVPGAPTGLSVTAGNAQLAVSWTAPASNGGASITGYVVEYTPSGGSASTASASSTNYTIASLTNGTSYSVRVAAVNSAGTGAYTSSSSATPTAGSSVSFSGSVVVSGANAPTVSGAGTSTLTFTKSNANIWADRVGFTVPSACAITWTPGAASPASYSSPGGNSSGSIYSASSNTLFNQLQKDGTYRCANGRYWCYQPWAMYLPAAGTYYFEGQSRASGTVGTLTITSASTITSPISVSGWTQSGLLWSKNTTYGSAASVTVSTKSAVLLAVGGVGSNLVTSFPFTVNGYQTTQELWKDGLYHTNGYTWIMILPAGTYSWGGLVTQTPSYFSAVPIA